MAYSTTQKKSVASDSVEESSKKFAPHLEGLEKFGQTTSEWIPFFRTWSEHKVMQVLADHAYGKNSIAHPAQKTIGEKIGLSDRQVRRILTALIKIRAITRLPAKLPYAKYRLNPISEWIMRPAQAFQSEHSQEEGCQEEDV